MRPSKAFFQAGVIIFILAFYGILLSRGINFVTADLGRHLKNGELFSFGHYIPNVNLYSYTYPDFPCINHHWGSGVIFFLIHKISGFVGLSIFCIILSLVAFFLFFHVAWRYSHFEIALVVSILAVPLLAGRPEIRPEIFSYLFSGLFFWILWNVRSKKLNWHWLFLLPLLEILWVNLHIYFLIGVMLVALFFMEYLITVFVQKDKEMINSFKKMGIILTSIVFATFLNPVGTALVMYPLKIWKNYGYSVIEEQPLYVLGKDLLYKKIGLPGIFYFKLIFALILLSWIFVFLKLVRRDSKKEKESNFSFANFALTAVFSMMGWMAIRNFAIFGYFALPITAINLRSLLKKEADSLRDYFFIFVLIILILFNMFLAHPAHWLQFSNIRIGLAKGATAAIDFFRRENIRGPLFNNYDTGGYLIYYLYPRQRVFVDNRPEAYPANFFKNIYIPMQENEKVWKEEDRKYNFNAIFFYRHVHTPWGQKFLIRRIFDPLWAVVYVDEYCIIILKRNGPNQSTVKKYELPKDIFSVAKIE